MRVHDVMTSVVHTVGPYASIDTAIAIMMEQRLSGVPVVDEAGLLVGILTEDDLLRRAETGTGAQTRRLLLDLLAGPGREALEYVRTHSRRVSDLMTTPVLTVTENDPLVDVVRLMERRRIRRVPVVRDGRPVGIVSRFDLIVALARALAALPPPPVGPAAAGAEIAAKVEQEWRGKRWLGKSSIGIRVEDGVATLEGIIHDERMRDAIRVAAQIVPGVTAISDRIVYAKPFAGAIVPA